MRRAILIVAVGLGVFAVAALAGFLTAARIAPERLQATAERQLSEIAEARVELGTVNLALGRELPWIELQAIDARISWPAGGSFQAERMSAALNPLSLIWGRVDLRNLELGGARAVLPEWGDGASQDPASADVPASLSADITWLDELAAMIRADPCPAPELDIRDLSIAHHQNGKVELLIEGAHGELRCPGLGFQGDAHIAGDLVAGPGQRVPMRAEIRAGTDEVELVLTTGEIPIQRWARTLHFETALRGDLGGSLRWRFPADEEQRLDLNLRGRNVAGIIGETNAPALDLALERPRLRVQASGRPDRLRLHFAELEDRGVSVGGDAVFALPFDGRASMQSRVAVHELSRGDIGHLLEQLPPAVREAAERVFERIESGTLANLEVGLRTTSDGFASITGRGPLTRPGELTVAMEFRDATLRAGDSDRLNGVSGRMRFDGDRFEVSEFTAEYGERRLERIDAAIVGLSHLRDPDDFRCDRPAHVDPMPGIDSFSEWRSSRRGPDADQSWQRMRLELDHVNHPVLFCGLSDVAAELVPDANGLDATVEHAVWAGLPIEANATYRESETGERVVLAATVGAPIALERDADDPVPPVAWAKGRFEIDATRIGEFRIRGAAGGVEVRGTQLELRDTALMLDPGGRIEGHAEVQLGGEGDPFYEAAIEIADVPLLDLWTSAGLERGLLSGHLHGAAGVRGTLHPNQNPLAHASGAVALHARRGEIHQKIPFVLAIVMAGDVFDPFQNRDRIAYDAIDLSGVLEAGELHVTNMTLTSPDVRAAASGEVDFRGDVELAMVVGVFFFPRLDGLIQKIPLLNRVFLGRNQNLVGAYFSLEGPADGPSARVVPSESIVQGGAGMVLALPAFVLSGIQQIQSMVIPQARTPKRAEDS